MTAVCNNYNRRDALSIMSDLPSSWPSCRLCINADAVATSYLAGMHRLFLEAKLNGKDQQTALQEANARAYEMEAMCLDPLASHLHQLFATDDDLFFDVYPDEWKQLQKLEFWQLSLMQEVSRIQQAPPLDGSDFVCVLWTQFQGRLGTVLTRQGH